MAAGMDPALPAAVISRGTTASQRQVVSTLEKLEEEVKQEQILSPALIVVGKVCGLSEMFHWAGRRPLGGKRVIVTRPKKRSRGMAERLTALGAEVILLPAIETECIADNQGLKDAFSRLSEYSWIAFTSAEGVDCFFDSLYKEGKDIRSLAGVRFAVIGPATGKALEKRGIFAALTAEPFTGEALGRRLAENMEPGERLLLPRADIGTEEVTGPLTEAGVSFDDIPVYRTKNAKADRILPQILPDDIVTFTSASTVRGFVSLYPDLDYRTVRGLCIGVQTEKEAAAYGIRAVVSREASMDSMVEKLLELSGQRGMEGWERPETGKN